MNANVYKETKSSHSVIEERLACYFERLQKCKDDDFETAKASNLKERGLTVIRSLNFSQLPFSRIEEFEILSVA